MIIKEIKDNCVYVEYNDEKYLIKRDYIGGTLIENYFAYGCYGIDDYEYFVGDYVSLEKALIGIMERDI